MEVHRMLRSLLFVPGNSPLKMAKAARLPADAIILDWEDAVLPSEKASARRSTIKFLLEENCRPLAFIRFNPAGSGAFEEDSKTLLEHVPQGIVLSKCRSAADVRRLADVLDDADPSGQCSICTLVESPEGLMNAASIARESSRVSTVAFGAEDFSAEMGIVRTADEIELLYARSTLVTACRAAGKEPIDSPFLEFRDLGQLRAAAQRARNLGFSGKLAIHPVQLRVLNQAFMPTEAELAQAREIVASFSSTGSGVTAVDGQMVDEAVVRRARRILEAAGLCGSTGEDTS